jgi:hypothetical protein
MACAAALQYRIMLCLVCTPTSLAFLHHLLLLLLFVYKLADKTVFPKQDIVGWYCSWRQLTERHLAVHRKVRRASSSSRQQQHTACELAHMRVRLV